MLKFVTALSAAVIVGFALAGSATPASAGGYYRGGGGGCCGPIPPSYSTSTKKVHKYIKRHRDVWSTRYIKRKKLHVHTTRIQPVYHIHTVVRHHTKLVGVVVPVHKHRTVWLPPHKIYTSSHVRLRPQCACGGSYGGY